MCCFYCWCNHETPAKYNYLLNNDFIETEDLINNLEWYSQWYLLVCPLQYDYFKVHTQLGLLCCSFSISVKNSSLSLAWSHVQLLYCSQVWGPCLIQDIAIAPWRSLTKNCSIFLMTSYTSFCCTRLLKPSISSSLYVHFWTEWIWYYKVGPLEQQCQ